MRTKLIILTSIAMALVVMAFPTNKFQPKTVWEHYCKYTLGIHPSQATEDQDKAYQEIIDQVNAEHGDGGVLQFYSLQGIKEYFEIVHIETQELTSIGFKTAILDL